MLVMPVEAVSALERRLAVAAAVAVSPFSGAQQVQDWGGEWWEYAFEMRLTRGRQARRLAAFFAGLRGPVGTFLWRDQSIMQQGFGGAPEVAGAGQTGSTLATAGWTPQAPALAAGDFFSIAHRLHQVTADAAADAAGAATLVFVPRLRASPPAGTPLEIAAPSVVLRLAGPVPAMIAPADIHRFSVTAREAL